MRYLIVQKDGTCVLCATQTDLINSFKWAITDDGTVVVDGKRCNHSYNREAFTLREIKVDMLQYIPQLLQCRIYKTTLLYE